jgi:hypothetical protein
MNLRHAPAFTLKHVVASPLIIAVQPSILVPERLEWFDAEVRFCCRSDPRGDIDDRFREQVRNRSASDVLDMKQP